jgi:hypothetical protein
LDLFSNKINEKNAAELQVILASSAKTLRGHQTGRIKPELPVFVGTGSQ